MKFTLTALKNDVLSMSTEELEEKVIQIRTRRSQPRESTQKERSGKKKTSLLSSITKNLSPTEIAALLKALQK